MKRSRGNSDRPRAAASLLVLAILLMISGLAPQLRADDWQLVWSDEFNYNGPPDPKKWGYELGMIRNNEPQCYTRSSRNVRVENGHLVLEAIKEKILDFQVFNPFRKKKTLEDRMIQDYSSASLCTQGKASWLYGKFEIRAKLPFQAGTWPVFWMLGINHSKDGWPECGEIDIMERMWQRNADQMSGIMTVLHFKSLLGHKRDRSNGNSFFHVTPVQGATTGFHILHWSGIRTGSISLSTDCLRTGSF